MNSKRNVMPCNGMFILQKDFMMHEKKKKVKKGIR